MSAEVTEVEKHNLNKQREQIAPNLMFCVKNGILYGSEWNAHKKITFCPTFFAVVAFELNKYSSNK